MSKYISVISDRQEVQKFKEMKEAVRVEMQTRVLVPVFRPEDYDSYLEDMEVWRQLCGLPKKEQALMLW